MTDSKVIGTIPPAEGVVEDVSPDVIPETPKLRPYLKVFRVDPNNAEEVDRDAAEGLQLVLSPTGSLIPEIAEAFILEMNAAKMPDGRTLTLTTRLRNNFLLTESYSVTSPEDFNQEALVELCKTRTLNKIWDYLTFLWHCATVSSNKVKAECGIDLYHYDEATSPEEPLN